MPKSTLTNEFLGPVKGKEFLQQLTHEGLSSMMLVTELMVVLRKNPSMPEALCYICKVLDLFSEELLATCLSPKLKAHPCCLPAATYLFASTLCILRHSPPSVT